MVENKNNNNDDLRKEVKIYKIILTQDELTDIINSLTITLDNLITSTKKTYDMFLIKAQAQLASRLSSILYRLEHTKGE